MQECNIAPLETPAPSETLDAALSYAAKGWYVVPLHHVTNGRCSCAKGPACGKDAGKHPHLEDWTNQCSIDPALIQRWWQQWPHSGVGIVTGERSRLAVLDLDPRNGGDLALEDLEHAYRPLPDTPLVLTGGNGRHYYFALDGPLAKFDPGPGLNLQAEGAQVVAPPSIHQSGTPYQWEASSGPDDVPLAPLPDWLRALGAASASAPVEGVELPPTLPCVEIATLSVSDRIKCLIQTGEDPDDPTRYCYPNGTPDRSRVLFAVLQALHAGGHDDATLASVVMDQRYAISEKVLSQKNARNPRYWEQTKGWVAREIARAKAKATTRTRPPIPDMTGHSNGTHAATPAPEPALPWSDYTNALTFVREHGQNLRYCYAWKSWLVWRGSHWDRDDTGMVPQWAKQTIKRLARRAEDLDDTAAKALMAHVKKSLSKASLDAMVRTAQDEPGIPIKPEDLDVDPWVLNVVNGTLDLKTGELRPHRQADLLTKCLPIAYDPEAQCSAWKAFLWRIMDQRQDLIDFLQRAIGYTLTGSTREQCLFILYGITKTGKSTLLALLRALLGPYGQQADMDSFMHKDRQEVRNDLADLAGSRFVCALEAQEGKRLAESLVKQLTGGVDLIKARFLFQEHFTFKPQFKLFLGTNHKPKIGDDDAVWERIRLVPFAVQIPKAERDKMLDETLQTELPGILAWAVRGCLEWQRLGELKEPEAVIDATAGYRSEMDTIGPFLDECCVIGPPDVAKVKASALASAYQAWCKRTGEHPADNRAFIKNLEDRKYLRERGTANQYYWHGFGLIPVDDERYESTTMQSY